MIFNFNKTVKIIWVATMLGTLFLPSCKDFSDDYDSTYELSTYCGARFSTLNDDGTESYPQVNIVNYGSLILYNDDLTSTAYSILYYDEVGTNLYKIYCYRTDENTSVTTFRDFLLEGYTSDFFYLTVGEKKYLMRRNILTSN